MTDYAVHTPGSAPEASRPALQALHDAFGLVPNLAGAMAGSPVLIGAFVDVFRKVHAGSFGEAQIQVLLLTDAVANACPWAVAFHTMLALKEGVAPADVRAIRERRAPHDAPFAALSALARAMIERRGHVDDATLGRFTAAGFTSAQALEAIAVVAASTITNYAGNLTNPPLEAMLQEHAWTP